MLFNFLTRHVKEGRAEFTNREVRLDSRIRLPEFEDNLEARLILLRRRLEEKQAPVRLARPERGRIKLELSGRPGLQMIDSDGCLAPLNSRVFLRAETVIGELLEFHFWPQADLPLLASSLALAAVGQKPALWM